MSELDSAIFKRALFRAIVLQPLALAAIAGLLLWQIDRVLAALGWVAPQSPVIERAHRVRELLVHMEYGLRGYVSNGDPNLAERSFEAAERVGEAIRKLEDRVAVRALPAEESALARLGSNFVAWQLAAEKLLAVEQSSQVTHPAAVAASSAMDAMKSAIVSLVDAEHVALGEYVKQRREGVRLAIGLALLGTFLLGLGVAFAARRQLLAVSRSYGEAIADQRSRADALRAAQAQAEAANRAKDDFLATVSHELRSPLNAILTSAQLLKLPQLDEEQTQRALELIDRNVKRQARLIEDLLEVSRIVAGKLTLDAQKLELAPIVKEAIQGIRPAATAGRLGLDVSFAEEPIFVWGDHGRLLQILTNVLANAAKFTPEGGRISVSLGVSGAEAEIVVTDTGVGIADEVLPKIFDRFAQADSSSTRKHAGLGLGLAIARHLVTLHHGTIHAASGGPNLGATFRIRLPLLAPDADVPGEADSDRSPETRPNALADVRVLVVDDEEDAREALAMLLSSHGANVSRTTSVAEALATLASFPADVVLTDVAMPDEDGYELLRRLRAEDAGNGIRRPVIAVTALASAEDQARLTRAGFDLNVTKPIDPDELVAAVANVVRSPVEARETISAASGRSGP